MRRGSGLAFAALDFVGCLFLVALLRMGTPTPPHITTFGTYAVTMTWPRGDNDVDLYLRDPAGGVCFYANVSVNMMHLEHDDLGYKVSGYREGNAERIVIRGIDAGEFIANVHMYRRSEGRAPLPVTVQLWSLQGEDKVVTERRVTITRDGDERTAFRFTVSRSGAVTATSHLPKSLVKNTATYYGG
jgi:hypothetical protein